MIDAVSDGQSLKTTLAALSPSQFDALTNLGSYYRLRLSLRTSGWSNLFWGGLTLYIGLAPSLFYPNIYSNIQAILGALIVAQSLWGIIRPGSKGFLALAVVLLLCGFWNMFIVLSSGFSGFELLIVLLGLFQIWWAFQSYKSYQLFSERPLPKPTADLVKQYDAIWQAIAHPSPILSPDLMTLHLASNRHWWRTLLLPDHAILANKRQKALMFFSKPEFIIFAENPKAINREEFAIFALLNMASLRGKIYRSGFQQYLLWKGITDSETEDNGLFARKRLIRKIVRWLVVGAFGVFLVYCAFIMNVISRIR